MSHRQISQTDTELLTQRGIIICKNDAGTHHKLITQGVSP